MVQQQKDLLLHLHTKHTNLCIPYSDYVNSDRFPQQHPLLLGNTVKIKYRDMYIVDDLEDDIKEPDKYDPHDIYEAECKVLRCDMVEPYRMICISLDYKFMFVTDFRYYEEIVVQYPIQYSQFIGITTRDQYVGIIPEIKGVTLRVDDGEPCYSIIMEYMEDNKVRFLLGDECFARFYDYYDAPDYNGRDSKEYENYIDVDGGKVDKTVNEMFYSIDAGPANNLHEMFKTFKSFEEITNIRKTLMEGKEIYGIS